MPSLADEVRKVSGADGVIILHIRNGTMFRINRMGSLVLDLWERGSSVPQISQQISLETGAPLHVVHSDINAFLNSLESHGILVRAASLGKTEGQQPYVATPNISI